MATDKDIIRTLASAAALCFGTTAEEIVSVNRGTPAAACARQAIYYTCRVALGWTLERIAEAFDRKHPSVISGLRAVEDRRDTAAFDARMAALEHAATAINAAAAHSIRKAA